MAIKPKRAARVNHMRKNDYKTPPKKTPWQMLKRLFTKTGFIILGGFFLTFVVLTFMFIVGFFASTSKDMAVVFANAILKFQSIRAGIFTSGILLLGVLLIGALTHKIKWMWSGVLTVTLIFVTIISAYVDFILYGETSSSYVPSQILDAIYKESTPYRTQNDLNLTNQDTSMSDALRDIPTL